MRVLAINDLSCVGKCSLTVALPIISACGITCDVLPTALLSTHTGGFEGYAFCDLSDKFPAILNHWKALGLTYDYIYSGYLGNRPQIETVLAIKREFLKEGGKLITDPVMGDNGALYDNFDEAYVNEMRKLCAEADFILPNLTEACLLAGTPYPKNGTGANIPKILDNLRSTHTCPIVTGVPEEKEIAVYYANGSAIKRFALPVSQGFFCGAGDVFASAFSGALARGTTPERAIALASEFTTASIKRTARFSKDRRYGLSFEEELLPFLNKLQRE